MVPPFICRPVKSRAGPPTTMMPRFMRMPTSPADFETVYENLVNSPAIIMSPTPCAEVGGQWYAAVG